jgi:asparagine synthase (glutamine-hydrolysing)
VADPDDNSDPYVELAKLVAPDTTFVTFGREHVEEVFEEVAYYLDTPATWTAFAQYFLAKRIAVDGGKIILSGEGADEIFYGYARYKALWWLDQMHADPVLDGYGETIARVLGDDARHLVGRVLDRGFNDAPWTYADAYGGPATHSCVSRLARTEWHTTMQVLLRMLDRMTGRFGLEGRAPFLDHRLIEFVSPLPDEYKITKHETKRLLRDVARRLGVPKAITESTGKRGLSIPWNHWHGIKSWNRDHFADAMYGSWWRAFDLDSP